MRRQFLYQWCTCLVWLSILDVSGEDNKIGEDEEIKAKIQGRFHKQRYVYQYIVSVF